VIDPTSRVGFLQFIHDLDSVFACGPVIRQDHAVFVIEVIVVTDIEAVTGHAVTAHRLIFRSCVLIPTSEVLCGRRGKTKQPRAYQ